MTPDADFTQQAQQQSKEWARTPGRIQALLSRMAWWGNTDGLLQAYQAGYVQAMQDSAEEEW